MADVAIQTVAADTVDGLGLPATPFVFHGEAIDERGLKALAACKGAATRMVNLSYDVDSMRLGIDDSSVGTDNCEKAFYEFEEGPWVFEATTLGFAELFCGIRSAIEMRRQRFDIIYTEPLDYSKVGPNEFALTDLLTGYKPIPPAIVDLSSPDVEAGVFFLGFEPERLDRALEEYQMIADKNVKVMFGLPAFQTGWELYSIVPHLQTLKERAGFQIGYCAANDPEAAFEALELTRATLLPDQKMFVAPIGTKPCGIASALFASIYPAQVGLLYDHPQRRPKRTEGVNMWHRFSVTVVPSQG